VLEVSGGRPLSGLRAAGVRTGALIMPGGRLLHTF
jgi:hypothetical protein